MCSGGEDGQVAVCARLCACGASYPWYFDEWVREEIPMKDEERNTLEISGRWFKKEEVSCHTKGL